MQALKVLVVVMGVLIIAGVAVVAVTIVNRLSHGSSSPGFSAANLTLPKGCHLVGMVSAGNRLALRLGDSAECQIILFVDPESGQQMGSLALQTQP
jgi:Family of unknown function (DUF6476)